MNRPWRALQAFPLVALGFVAPHAATAEEPPTKLCWRLVRVDTSVDHDVNPDWLKSHEVTRRPDGSLFVRSRTYPDATWDIQVGAQRATCARTDSQFEVSWTKPPDVWCSDAPTELMLRVTSSGGAYSYAYLVYGTAPSAHVEPEPGPGAEAASALFANVVAYTAGGPKYPTSAEARGRVRPGIPGTFWSVMKQTRDPWMLIVNLTSPSTTVEVHYHYEMLLPGEEGKPDDKPPVDEPTPGGCERTFAKSWPAGTWGDVVIRVTGTTAEGTYTNRSGASGAGTFAGTVSGSVLEGRWKDARGSGTLRLVLADDGCSWQGSHTVDPPGPDAGVDPKGWEPGKGEPGDGPGKGKEGKPGPVGPEGTVPKGGPGQGLPADACIDPGVQRCIDEWLDLAMRIRNQRDRSDARPGGPWRVSQYGQLLGHSVVSAQPPDGWETRYRRSKHCYVWENWQNTHAEAIYGGELPPLKSSVEACVGVGKPGDPPGPTGITERRAIQADQRFVEEAGPVWVPLWLLGGMDVANADVVITYDPAVARIEGEVARGNLLTNGLLSVNAKEPGVVRLGLAQTTGISGTGTLAYLPFRAVGKPGMWTWLEVNVESVDDTTGNPLTYEGLRGWVWILGEHDHRGDCDGDGRSTELDALCALEMAVGLRPVRLAMDMDGDGKVTSRDAAIILRRAIGIDARGGK